jgi:hypothetical protein
MIVALVPKTSLDSLMVPFLHQHQLLQQNFKNVVIVIIWYSVGGVGYLTPSPKISACVTYCDRVTTYSVALRIDSPK